MKKSAVLFCLILFSLTTFAQKPKSAKPASSSAKPFAPDSGNEKEIFEKAVDQKNAAERIMALNKFVANFPKSAEKTRALELIVSARAEIADERLRLNDTASGIELFTLAVKNAPTPVSDKLFTEIILQIPTNLFFRGQQANAVEVAKLIEQKVEGNAKQLLGLATFYLGTENADEAKRLAEKAIVINPNLPAAYQTLGLANRLNFQLEEATVAYSKALELDANSIVSKRSLAEMKRATAKPDEAAALYREILAKDEADTSAQTGLALALLDADKRTEAEAETAKAFAQNPNNLPLLVGAAYWYAAHDDGAKAVELAQQAVAVEPRYTWAYIALARGLIQQKRSLEAEKVLLTARQYGNFPTLDYEIATARYNAGFYREAAEELKKRFIVKDGLLETRLGGRVATKAKNFIELLSMERRAGIFEPTAADSAENADKIKSLLEFTQKLESTNENETSLADSAEEFSKGDDKMKVHRQIFVANQLLENKKALPKVLELTKAAVGGVDSALDSASPAAAILADELYESRRTAMIRGQLVIVPNVPQQTLMNILRGRIEDISGWALYQQGKTSEAAIRLKRAVSILPDKSAWWRTSQWRLGSVLDADGKSKEALEAYIKSYTNAEPDASRRLIIEAVYQKLNGSLEGLDQRIAGRPVTASAEPVSQPTQSRLIAQNTTEKMPSRVPVAQTTPTPEIQPTPEQTPEIRATPEPTATIQATPEPTLEIRVTPEIKSTPEPTPEIRTTPEPTPEVKATPEQTPEIKTTPEPSPSQTPEQIAKVEAENKPTPETQIENTVAVLTNESNPAKKPQIENQNPELKTAKTAKPLFEPIIINVPKSEPVKPVIETTENSTEEKPLDTNNSSRTIRDRVITGKKSDVPDVEIVPCKILVSQENVSLINGGGNLGILVGYEERGDLTQLKASSNSPDDVEISFVPEIGGQSGRAFFVIKSISSNKGFYTVTFDAPCGKKNVSVRVR